MLRLSTTRLQYIGLAWLGSDRFGYQKAISRGALLKKEVPSTFEWVPQWLFDLISLARESAVTLGDAVAVALPVLCLLPKS